LGGKFQVFIPNERAPSDARARTKLPPQIDSISSTVLIVRSAIDSLLLLVRRDGTRRGEDAVVNLV
jgi:hypothetical protein